MLLYFDGGNKIGKLLGKLKVSYIYSLPRLADCFVFASPSPPSPPSPPSCFPELLTIFKCSTPEELPPDPGLHHLRLLSSFLFKPSTSFLRHCSGFRTSPGPAPGPATESRVPWVLTRHSGCCWSWSLSETAWSLLLCTPACLTSRAVSCLWLFLKGQ